MASKVKLQSKSAKKKTIPTKINNVEAEQPNNSTSPMTPELEQQFELELCWCIQQLQNALKSGKLNNKQVQDHTKALNTLMSNSSPIIKKRQVMRLSFGDYRAKMAAEHKKNTKLALNMKVKPGTPSKKSVFIKRSLASSNGNAFRFNFPPPNEVNDINDSISNIKIETKDCDRANESKEGKINFCQFVPSDNSFRFKFNNDGEES